VRSLRPRALALTALVSAAAGCLNADRFLDEFMELRCRWQKSCQTAYFDENWVSIGECVAEEKDRIQELRAGCDYDRKEAKECLDAAEAWFEACSLEDTKYAAYIEQCEQVYTCSEDEMGDTTGETGA
jgi:hypothetical protein